MVTISDTDIKSKPEIMHQHHKLVKDILMKVVTPMSQVPTMKLEDLNTTLVTVLEMVIKHLYNEQFIPFINSIDTSFYDTNIIKLYDDITYYIMKTTSSRFVLSPLLFYIEKSEIYHYIKTMIVSKYTIKIVEEIREQNSIKSNIDKDVDLTQRITEITNNLINAFMISYDIDQVRYLTQELINIEYKEKTEAINNAIQSSTYICPLFIQRLLTNPNLITTMENNITSYFQRANKFHTKEGFVELYKSVSLQTPDILERIETTRQHRNSYHNISTMKLIDKITIEEIKILNAILADQSIEQYKSSIENNIILKNIRTALERSRSIDDSVIINNHELIIRSSNGVEKHYNYHDDKLSDKLNNPLQMFGTMSKYYEDDPEFWQSEKSALMATGIHTKEFNKAVQNKYSTLLKMNKNQRLAHRRSQIRKLESLLQNNSDVINKAKNIRSYPLREFKYAQSSYSNVFHKANNEDLFLALVELEQAYKQIKTVKGGLE